MLPQSIESIAGDRQPIFIRGKRTDRPAPTSDLDNLVQEIGVFYVRALSDSTESVHLHYKGSQETEWGTEHSYDVVRTIPNEKLPQHKRKKSQGPKSPVSQRVGKLKITHKKVQYSPASNADYRTDRPNVNYQSFSIFVRAESYEHTPRHHSDLIQYLQQRRVGNEIAPQQADLTKLRIDSTAGSATAEALNSRIAMEARGCQQQRSYQ